MSSYLKPVDTDADAYEEIVGRIDDQKHDIGVSGGGDSGSFLRVDKHTGDLTFGKDNVPLAPGHRFVLGLHNIHHGYVVWDATRKQPTSRHMASMGMQGPAPIPPGGKYVKYGEDGPRKCIELTFDSIDEPGFRVTFSSMAVSNDNRIRRTLLEPISLRKRLPETKAGFIHPVVVIRSDKYKHADYGYIHTIDFEIKDWLHANGETLLSEHRKLEAAKLKAVSAPAPELDDEELNALERDLMRI